MAREVLEENLAATQSGTSACKRLAGFLKASALDFVLVLFVSVALVMTVSFAFNSAPDYRGNAVLVALLCLPMLLILFAGSWSRRAVLPSAIAAIVYAVLLMLAAMTLTTSAGIALFVDGQLNDVAGNLIVFASVVIVVPVLVYLLSRRTVGLVFLLIAGVLSCCWVQFLYRDWANSMGVSVSGRSILSFLKRPTMKS